MKHRPRTAKKDEGESDRGWSKDENVGKKKVGNRGGRRSRFREEKVEGSLIDHTFRKTGRALETEKTERLKRSRGESRLDNGLEERKSEIKKHGKERKEL